MQITIDATGVHLDLSFEEYQQLTFAVNRHKRFSNNSQRLFKSWPIIKAPSNQNPGPNQDDYDFIKDLPLR